ncbi:MAG: hypothetical protein HYR88_14365, partial [Verrucomicrobia bacterium]|nr:hypothetical protein [Verrucomicrobiota bacterium]
FLIDIPCGQWTAEAAAMVAALVGRREGATSPTEQEALEAQIEAYVSEALGLSPEERSAIEAWASADENWQARERVRVQMAPALHRSPGRG